MTAAPREYGFYSNVNPDVDHPRWTQAKERRIGEFAKRKTLMFNGYGEQVAQLYAGMDLKKYFNTKKRRHEGTKRDLEVSWVTYESSRVYYGVVSRAIGS